MNNTDLYKAYTDDTVLNSNPLGLVIALYEGALEAIKTAKHCFEANDIAGRAKAINKTFAILTELMSSLDHKQGAEISKNLASLYDYSQRRLLDAHLKKNLQALIEVEKLLSMMLDGWKEAGKGFNPFAQAGSSTEATIAPAPPESQHQYGSYFADYAEIGGRPAFSF